MVVGTLIAPFSNPGTVTRGQGSRRGRASRLTPRQPSCGIARRSASGGSRQVSSQMASQLASQVEELEAGRQSGTEALE